MLDNVVSSIDHVVVNYQNQLELMAYEAMFTTEYFPSRLRSLAHTRSLRLRLLVCTSSFRLRLRWGPHIEVGARDRGPTRMWR
jgi:hypothetical protein